MTDILDCKYRNLSQFIKILRYSPIPSIPVYKAKVRYVRNLSVLRNELIALAHKDYRRPLCKDGDARPMINARCIYFSAILIAQPG